MLRSFEVQFHPKWWLKHAARIVWRYDDKLIFDIVGIQKIPPNGPTKRTIPLYTVHYVWVCVSTCVWIFIAALKCNTLKRNAKINLKVQRFRHSLLSCTHTHRRINLLPFPKTVCTSPVLVPDSIRYTGGGRHSQIDIPIHLGGSFATWATSLTVV